MLRQQYQEKFFKTKQIKSINEEVKEIFYLFEELENEVKNYQTAIDTIEDNVEQIKSEVKDTEETIVSANYEEELRKKYNMSLYVIIGGGLGSFIIAYNPYVGIGGIVGGMFIGSIIGYFK
jgi:t-SNARE complex subunit (syntaxin)